MIYVANVKYGTNSFQEAKEYIDLLNQIAIQEQNDVEVMEKVMPSSSNKKVPPLPLNTEINELKVSLAQLNNTTTLAVDNIDAKKLELVDPMITDCKKKNSDFADKAKRYFTRTCAQLSLETSTEATHSQKSKLSVTQDSELIRTSKPLRIPRLYFDNEFIEVLTRQHSECKKKQLILDNMRLANVQHYSALGKAIEFTRKFNNFFIKYSNVTTTENVVSAVREEKNDVMEVTNDNEEVKTMEVQIEKEKNNSNTNKKNEDKNNHFPEKIRGEAREFTLPPEYDANDSKWTLKHLKKKKGLVELLPYSKVFINDISLSNCHRLSQDSKTLARMLMLEIFTQNALRTCSLTGRRANAFNLDGKNVRPGLNKHAITVLLNYVEQYSINKNWIKVSSQSILSSLRNKIQEIRDKFR